MFPSLLRFAIILLVTLNLGSVPALAEEEESADQPTPDVHYVNLDPALVINLDSKGKRSHYLQLNVVVRVLGADQAERVSYHQAPIRHALIMLISDRDRKEISSIEDREALRQEARKVVQEALGTYEEGLEIQDLLFTNYVIQ